MQRIRWEPDLHLIGAEEEHEDVPRLLLLLEVARIHDLHRGAHKLDLASSAMTVPAAVLTEARCDLTRQEEWTAPGRHLLTFAGQGGYVPTCARTRSFFWKLAIAGIELSNVPECRPQL